MVNIEQGYDAFKYWGPIVTAFFAVYKGFKAAERGFQAWIEQILNGRIKGIQTTNEQIVALLHRNVTLLEELKDADGLKASKVEQVRMDLVDHTPGYS